MGNYYLDIETTGFDPKCDKILTIQYQKLDFSGNAIGDLIILKEWESSEKEILTKFIQDTGICSNDKFAFVVIGYNLGFEHKFLKERSVINSLPEIDILSKPFLDLYSIGILMNNGQFKGSGLDNISGKKGNGSTVPIFYENKEYDKIISYIDQETKEFLRLAKWLYEKMPALGNEFKIFLRS